MNYMTINPEVSKIVGEICIIEKRDTRAAAQRLAGMFGTIAADLPEEVWRRMKMIVAQPCHRKGCECHLTSTPLFDALETIRDKMHD